MAVAVVIAVIIPVPVGADRRACDESEGGTVGNRSVLLAVVVAVFVLPRFDPELGGALVIGPGAGTRKAAMAIRVGEPNLLNRREPGAVQQWDHARPRCLTSDVGLRRRSDVFPAWSA